MKKDGKIFIITKDAKGRRTMRIYHADYMDGDKATQLLINIKSKLSLCPPKFKLPNLKLDCDFPFTLTASTDIPFPCLTGALKLKNIWKEYDERQGDFSPYFMDYMLNLDNPLKEIGNNPSNILLIEIKENPYYIEEKSERFNISFSYGLIPEEGGAVGVKMFKCLADFVSSTNAPENGVNVLNSFGISFFSTLEKRNRSAN